MKIHLITISKKPPSWIESGFKEYAKRLPSECQLNLVEISPPVRAKNIGIEKIIQLESEKMLATIKPKSLVIALDDQGKQWSTSELAHNLQNWREHWQDLSLLVGGPDGLSQECLQKAQHTWSLSRLTFPHQLVRIIVAEQIYRAWSVLHNHPYHRE